MTTAMTCIQLDKGVQDPPVATLIDEWAVYVPSGGVNVTTAFAEVEAGDVLIVVGSDGGGVVNWEVPVIEGGDHIGFTDSGAGGMAMACSYYVCDGTEVDFDLLSSSGYNWIYAVQQWRGLDATNPFQTRGSIAVAGAEAGPDAAPVTLTTRGVVFALAAKESEVSVSAAPEGYGKLNYGGQGGLSGSTSMMASRHVYSIGSHDPGPYTTSGGAGTGYDTAKTAVAFNFDEGISYVEYVGRTSASFYGATGSAIALDGGLEGGSDSAVQEGDVVLAFVAVGKDNNGQPVAPSMASAGWTEEFAIHVAAFSGIKAALYTKRMGATPDASFTLGAVATDNQTIVEVRVFRGVHADIWDVPIETAWLDGNQEIRPPAITPATRGALICAWGASGQSNVEGYARMRRVSKVLQDTAIPQIQSTSAIRGWKPGMGTFDTGFIGGNTTWLYGWIAATVALKPA